MFCILYVSCYNSVHFNPILAYHIRMSVTQTGSGSPLAKMFDILRTSCILGGGTNGKYNERYIICYQKLL